MVDPLAKVPFGQPVLYHLPDKLRIGFAQLRCQCVKFLSLLFRNLYGHCGVHAENRKTLVLRTQVLKNGFGAVIGLMDISNHRRRQRTPWAEVE